MNFIETIKIQDIRKDIQELQSGNPRITGEPTFAGGFCFSDGTCQTTAPSASGITTTSSPTASGAWIFTSSVTIGPTVYTTTVSLSNILVNGRTVVASSAPAGSSAVTFTGLDSKKMWFLHQCHTKATSGNLRITFNGDAGNNYYNFPNYTDSLNNNLPDREVGVAFISLSGTTGVGDTVTICSNVEIMPWGNAVHVTGYTTYGAAAGNLFGMANKSFYNGAAGISQMTVYVNGGTFTGQIWLEVMGAAKP